MSYEERRDEILDDLAYEAVEDVKRVLKGKDEPEEAAANTERAIAQAAAAIDALVKSEKKALLQSLLDQGSGGGNWRRLITTRLAALSDKEKSK